MKFFVMVLVAAFLSFSAHADERECGAYCGPPTGIKPAIPDEADICFIQDHRDTVVLSVILAGGKARMYQKSAPVGRSCFRIGRHWLNPGTTATLRLCNGKNHSTFDHELVARLYAARGMRTSEYACLDGKACKTWKEGN